MSETCIAQGLAQVMIYNNMDKQWESPAGSDGSVTTVQLLQNRSRLGFRIISRRADNAILLNSNLFQKLKYHAATNNFHQWRDEEKRVFGLSFRYEQEAQAFIDVVRQAIETLEISMNNGVSDYQQGHAADNVYQDPHQHLMHIHSAPNFHHDENQNANFRKTSQHASTLYSASAMTQQQRRASQTSSTSAGSSAPPVAPPISNIPQAPPPPPAAGIAPVNTSAAPPPPPLPPVGAGAPPPPPPPPPPAALMAGASNGAPTLMDQIKQKTALRSTGGPKTNGVAVVEEKPAAPAAPKADLFSEMQSLFNKRKNTQAKSDAVDSKSNTSNGSSDSGCGIGTNGSNGGSVGSATAKKWSVSDGPKPLDSPKTHRKLPSASSLFSQEDSSKPGTSSMTNGTATPAASGVSNEQLERLRADLMVEVRLEMNKLRQDLLDAQERSKKEIIDAVLSAIGRR